MMMPKFADAIAWQQAELLMQPVFIRLIDNLRKQLEQSVWKGTYRDVPVWAEDVPPATRLQVTQLQQQLAHASPEQAEAIEQALAHLPQAHPGYELCLEHQDQQVNLNLWELCYQICFDHYDSAEAAHQPIAIDTSLIDEAGEVDWQQLDKKASRIVGQIFDQLPATKTL